MPFVRISLIAGRSPEYLAAVSQSVHRALVEAFETPEDDCFQAIHQHAPHELIFDRDYKGGPRSSQYVLIQVTAGRPRSAAAKKAFYARLAEFLHRSPGIPEADVMAVITTTGMEDWSFSHGECAV